MDPYSKKDFTLRVRCTNKSIKQTKKYASTVVIIDLLDKFGNEIGALVPMSLFDTFERNKCYLIRNGSVRFAGNQFFNSTVDYLSIMFTAETLVVQVDDDAAIPHNKFRFTRFQTVHQMLKRRIKDGKNKNNDNNNSKRVFVDVIGVMVYFQEGVIRMMDSSTETIEIAVVTDDVNTLLKDFSGGSNPIIAFKRCEVQNQVLVATKSAIIDPQCGEKDTLHKWWKQFCSNF